MKTKIKTLALSLGLMLPGLLPAWAAETPFAIAIHGGAGTISKAP